MSATSEIGPGLGVLVPEGECVRSWRVWDYRGVDGGCPVLRTVQVWQICERRSRTWQVWSWDHWTPYWSRSDRLVKTRWDPYFGSLVAANKRARELVQLFGGRRWCGRWVISCDAEAIAPKDAHRWERCDVDPSPPWLESWPGPQNWRAQLQTVAGVGTILS